MRPFYVKLTLFPNASQYGITDQYSAYFYSKDKHNAHASGAYINPAGGRWIRLTRDQ